MKNLLCRIIEFGFYNYVKALILSSCIFSSSISLAVESVAYQNWVVDISSNNTEAHTINESGSSFGLFCSGDTCLFYLHQNYDCKPGEKYSALINSGSLSGPVTLQCTKINGSTFQIIDPFNLVLDACKNFAIVSFAIPLSDGRFTIARFSLAGSAEAMRFTLIEASKAKLRPQPSPAEPFDNQPGAKGLKDITL
jgi:hypothetical protein